MLVYSRRSNSKHKENLTSQAPRELEPMIAPSFHKSPADTGISELDLPIALRKKPRTCTLHPISRFVSNSNLSSTFNAFTSSLTSIEFSKNVQALVVLEWRGAVMEEMKALKKGNVGCNGAI